MKLFKLKHKKMFLFSVNFIILNLLFSQTKNISNGTVFEGEPFVAVNPINSNHIAIAWMGFVPVNGIRLSIKVKSSFDGGLTWKSTVTLPHIVSTYKSADPSMVFDQQGNLFLAFIDYRENPDSGGIYITKSINGGINWSKPVLVLDAYADGGKRPIDRPWLAIDNVGKLYVTSKPAPWIPAPNRPYYTFSADAGQTWKPWKYIDSAGFLVGNLIQAPMAAPICSGSKFFAAYPTYLSSQNVLPQYILATKKNNNSNFTYAKIFSSANSPANDSAKLAYKLLADPSDTNHLVFIYPYAPNGDIDILMTETFDAGTNWKSPIKLNDDKSGNGKMQDLLWGDFNEEGDLIVAWRDRRNENGKGYAVGSEFYATYRSKDSSNFAPNFKLSDSLVAYNSILNQSGNDFMGIELTKDTLSAVWANTKDGSLDVWFLRKKVTTGQITSLSLLTDNPMATDIYPNPSSSGIYRIKNRNNAIINTITVTDINGKVVLKKEVESAEVKFDISNCEAGVYFLQIEIGSYSEMKKIILQK